MKHERFDHKPPGRHRRGLHWSKRNEGKWRLCLNGKRVGDVRPSGAVWIVVVAQEGKEGLRIAHAKDLPEGKSVLESWARANL